MHTLSEQFEDYTADLALEALDEMYERQCKCCDRPDYFGNFDPCDDCLEHEDAQH